MSGRFLLLFRRNRVPGRVEAFPFAGYSFGRIHSAMRSAVSIKESARLRAKASAETGLDRSVGFSSWSGRCSFSVLRRPVIRISSRVASASFRASSLFSPNDLRRLVPPSDHSIRTRPFSTYRRPTWGFSPMVRENFGSRPLRFFGMEITTAEPHGLLRKGWWRSTSARARLPPTRRGRLPTAER